jgi:transposase InsO family protein
VPLGYLQLDGVKVCWNGETCYFLSALEVKTRRAWVVRCPRINSLHAKRLLETVLGQVSYTIHTIHTDNGSEFKAYFDQAVQDLKLTHLWSPPRTPKVHAHMERFNKTLQEEFVDYHIDDAFIDPELFNQKLTQWLVYYNTIRPHHSLGLLTPHQYLVHLQKEDAQSLKCP